MIVGTHRLLSQDVYTGDLGLLIVDEEHRFGVKNKEKIKTLKSGVDVLTLTATPIPRTMMLSFFGDMDVSILNEKPKNRKDIVTLLKPENKISELWPLIKKEMSLNRQIFWVCPLIDESKKIDHQSLFNSVSKGSNVLNETRTKSCLTEAVLTAKTERPGPYHIDIPNALCLLYTSPSPRD